MGKLGLEVLLVQQVFSAVSLANVIAAEEVIACAISDQLWRELYSREASFRHWCDQQLWPQELLKLLEVLEQNTPEVGSSALEKLEEVLQSAERCSPNKAAVEAALEAGKLYVTSESGTESVSQSDPLWTYHPANRSRFG